MQTIQPSSLTDDELVKQAHFILDTEKVLPLAWQIELLARVEHHVCGGGFWVTKRRAA